MLFKKIKKFFNKELLFLSFKIILGLLVLINNLFFIAQANGESVTSKPLVPCGGEGQPNCQLCHLFVLFDNIIDFVILQLVPIVAVFMIAISGFMFMMAYFEAVPSGGEGGASLISKARKTIVYTIIGIIIVYSSWALVNLFFQLIGVSEFEGGGKWWNWKVKCPGV
jgi:hypothetical protein